VEPSEAGCSIVTRFKSERLLPVQEREEMRS
jgi:hypothetical protein